MAKYKVGDIFINHNDGKMLQVCEGECNDGCCYMSCRCKGIFNIDVSCREVIGCFNLVKELSSLPPGTKVKLKEDLKIGAEYGLYTFVENMKSYREVTIKQYNAVLKKYIVFENMYSYTLEMFDQVINEPKENNNMETKEIKINVPEGYEIDKDNSTFECIKLKPIKKELTYKDAAEKLFGESGYYTNEDGIIMKTGFVGEYCTKPYANNATNTLQLNRLLALNMLLNIAEYYNKKNPKEKIYCINFDKRNFEYFVQNYTSSIVKRGLIPEFNREEDARAVINNPNFKEILDLVYKGNED